MAAGQQLLPQARPTQQRSLCQPSRCSSHPCRLQTMLCTHRFRSVKLDNAKFRAAVWEVPGAAQVCCWPARCRQKPVQSRLQVLWLGFTSAALELLLGLTCFAAAAGSSLVGHCHCLPAPTTPAVACLLPLPHVPNTHTRHNTPLLQVLFLVGWRQHGDTLSLPADAPLGPLQAAASRLRRLADKKGHSGEAVAVEPAGQDGSRPPSQYYGTPGFQYQEQASLSAWPPLCARFGCIWVVTAVGGQLLGSQDVAGAGAAASCTEPAILPCSVPHLHCCWPALRLNVRAFLCPSPALLVGQVVHEGP